jgi:hypothetical protein
MGNKIYVDNKPSEINEILNIENNLLKDSFDILNLNKENDINENIKNLKIWKFYERENKENKDEKIFCQSIDLANIKKDHFLFDAIEAYIILIIQKSKDKSEDIAIFPNSLWGIVKSSSNLTPRGLKYAFASTSTKIDIEINLESYLLSKRNFKDNDYKYNLFIWNGNKSSPNLKSNVLMKAYDLDKKLSLSNQEILPFLYKGFLFENSRIFKSDIKNLNKIIDNNKIDNYNSNNNYYEDPITPTTESMRNFHENIYLLQILYPKKIKKLKKIKEILDQNHLSKLNENNQPIKSNRSTKKPMLFPRLVKNFINPKNKINYFDNFISYDSMAGSTVPNSRRSQKSEKSKDKNYNFNLNKEFSSLKNNDRKNEKENEKENENENEMEKENFNPYHNPNRNYHNDLEEENSYNIISSEYEEEYEEDDVNDDLYFEENNIGKLSKLTLSKVGNGIGNLNDYGLGKNIAASIGTGIGIDGNNNINNNINSFTLKKEKNENENISNLALGNIKLKLNNTDTSNKFKSEPQLQKNKINNIKSMNTGNIKNFPNGNIINKNSEEREFQFSNQFPIKQPLSLSSSRNENNSNRLIADSKSNSNSNSNLKENDESNKSFSIESQRSNGDNNNIKNKEKFNENNNNNKSKIGLGSVSVSGLGNSNDLKIPKLIFGIQKKIINDEDINNLESKIEDLPYSVIKKSSDKILNLNLASNINNKNNDNKNKNNNIYNNNKNMENKISNKNLGKLNINNINKINENNETNDNDRKNIVIDFFSKIISEIIEGFIYISNYNVAKNKEMIQDNKITHIVNASSDNCLNHFSEEGVTYLNYNLKDHPIEV